MDIQAYEDFLQIIDSIAGSEMSFRYEVETERGYQIVKSAINEAKELGVAARLLRVQWECGLIAIQ